MTSQEKLYTCVCIWSRSKPASGASWPFISWEVRSSATKTSRSFSKTYRANNHKNSQITHRKFSSIGNVTLRRQPPVVFLNEEEKRSPNIWTSQSCFASSNWFSECEHPFFNKLDITEPAVPSARLLGLHSPLWGCAGDWVQMVVKVHCGTVLEDAFQHGRKFAAQNSPTMHFDIHLDPVFHATSNWRIGHFRVPKTLTFKMRPSAQLFLWKWVIFAWKRKVISISKAEHLSSFWYRGPGELGSGLLPLLRTNV